MPSDVRSLLRLTPAFKRVGVAGVGLVGGSVALAVHAANATVTAFETDAAALAYVLEKRMVDTAVADLATLARVVDVLVLAAPLPATLAALAELRALDASGPWPELILDVASTKRAVAQAGATVRNFVPSHPIAGAERRGPRAARADLFTGRTWAFVPTDPTRDRLAREFITTLGAEPLPIGAQRHDDVLALTSHLPQLVSTLLAATLAGHTAEPDVSTLCGPGMSSMLRLAHAEFALWEPIFSENRVAVAALLGELTSRLEAVRLALERREVPKLASYFADAHRAVRELEERSSKPPR